MSCPLMLEFPKLENKVASYRNQSFKNYKKNSLRVAKEDIFI